MRQEGAAAAASGVVAEGGLNGVRGCAFCGGLGHRITDCPKLDKQASQKAGGMKEALKTGDGYSGDW